MKEKKATPEVHSSQALEHRPVLLHTLIESLQPKPGETVVDATLGGGSVTQALLDLVTPGGTVIAFDRDLSAIERARSSLKTNQAKLILEHGNFSGLSESLMRQGIETVDRVVFDLGISSIQLDDPDRGFSLRLEGPLDMRMDQSTGITAADIVNSWDEISLVELLRKSDERFARPIARAIIKQRPVTTTQQLSQLVEGAIPRKWWPKHIHSATKTFMALRIATNSEMESLDKGLQAAINALRPGGRIGVISFHSLEDTLVKHTLNVAATSCICPPQQPICTCAHRATLSLLKRSAIKPSDDEVAQNPRSRSARLRVAEKL